MRFVTINDITLKLSHTSTCIYVNAAYQAALGDTIDVLTLDGMVEMKIKPGTQSGTKLSLTAKGVKHLNEGMVAGSRR
jgi:molecular chaperone DnaJ